MKAVPGIKVAAVSRTTASELYDFLNIAFATVMTTVCRAREALRCLLLQTTDDANGPTQEAIKFFDELEIYPGI